MIHWNRAPVLWIYNCIVPTILCKLMCLQVISCELHIKCSSINLICWTAQLWLHRWRRTSSHTDYSESHQLICVKHSDISIPEHGKPNSIIWVALVSSCLFCSFQLFDFRQGLETSSNRNELNGFQTNIMELLQSSRIELRIYQFSSMSVV